MPRNSVPSRRGTSDLAEKANVFKDVLAFVLVKIKETQWVERVSDNLARSARETNWVEMQYQNRTLRRRIEELQRQYKNLQTQCYILMATCLLLLVRVRIGW